MWAPGRARLSSCSPSKGLASKKSLRLPDDRTTECSIPFLWRASTCARRPAWPSGRRAGECKTSVCPRNGRRRRLLHSEPHKPRPILHCWRVMTLTREQIRELAELQDPKSCAVSFYFQPATPRNKAHKEDTILIKDLAREAQHSLESKGKREGARADLDRVVRLSGELRSNGTHAKAVFACAAQGFWREYELPAELPGTQLFVD